jgi:hypothetical protein
MRNQQQVFLIALARFLSSLITHGCNICAEVLAGFNAAIHAGNEESVDSQK